MVRDTTYGISDRGRVYGFYHTGHPIDLNELSSSSFFVSISTYDPASFPGVIVRHPSICPRTILVHSNGKVIVLDADSERGVDEALDLIEPELKTSRNDFQFRL